MEYRDRHYLGWQVAASGASGGKILNSRGVRIVRSVIDSVLCHRPSHLLLNSALYSVLYAVIDSALHSDNLSFRLRMI